MRLDEQPRPKLQLAITKSEIALEILAAVPCILTAVVTILFYPALPDVVASHFDMQGHANGWSTKGILLVLSLFGAGTYVAMFVMMRFPHTYNYVWPITETNAHRQYMLARKFMRLLKLELLMLLLIAVWSIIQFNLGTIKTIDSIQLLVLTLIVIATSFGYIAVAYTQR